ncbi:MAG: rRNA pseudouridine synthase [bacterium]|nr:rRNA pseudouridine synthase [bacterium]
MERLQKFMAACGVASRRESEALIAAGSVTVNGEPAHVGQSIDPAADKVLVNGQPVSQDEKVYLVLNKPRGVVTSAKDTHNRRTVLDCIKGVDARVFPVGRLDLDVEGALLLTNDGELAFGLTHPRFMIDKVYQVRVEGVMDSATASHLTSGVLLEDGVTAPAKVSIMEHGPETTLVRLTLHEGRKREVKRMCAAVGHPVRALRRVSVANVNVEGLKPGQWRHLNTEEVQRLREAVGLPG